MKRYLITICLALFSIASYAQDDMPYSFETQEYIGPVQYVNFHDLSFDDTQSRILYRSDPPAAPADSAVRWIDRIYNMPQCFIDFYNSYEKAVNDVLNGKDNYLSDPTRATQDQTIGSTYYVPIKEWQHTISFEYPRNWTSEQVKAYSKNITDELQANYSDTVALFLPYLLMCLNYDFPQAFWINNSQILHMVRAPSANTRYGNGNAEITFSYSVLLIVKKVGYSIVIDEYSTLSDLHSAVSDFKEQINIILSGVPNGSTYDKVVYLNDWIAEHNAYSTGKTASIIWSAMSAIKGSTGSKGPVCEGYARAFKVLADALEIPSRLVIGKARTAPGKDRESHMWNEVKMDDGKWYGLDVTWNDPTSSTKPTAAKSGNENHNWLLLGKNSNVNGLPFDESHPVNMTQSLSSVDKLYCYLFSYLTDQAYTPKSRNMSDFSIDDMTNQVDHTFSADSPAPLKIHSLTGVFIGQFATFDEARRQLAPGLYIINSRKTVIR
ncbi:MAG: transglutaminase domain-containing protein [Bacteroidaceae bacterium]|nr:transglutaminase domain-containing protein [Bacteroidaceae bacterium]